MVLRSGRDLRLDVFEPLVEELRQRGLARLKVDAAIDVGDQPCALDLRFAFRALEAVPFALPLSRNRIAGVEVRPEPQGHFKDGTLGLPPGPRVQAASLILAGGGRCS